MRRIAGLLTLIAGCGAGSAAAQPVSPPAAPQPSYVLVEYEAPPPTVACADGQVRVRSAESFVPNQVTVWPSMSAASRPREAYEFTFRITPEGRTASIAPAVKPPATGLATPPVAVSMIGSHEEELQATLASWTFEPSSSERRDCRLQVRGRTAELTQARRESLYRVFAEPGNLGSARTKIRDLLRPPGADCHSRRPEPLVIHYPDAARIPLAPGRRTWAVVEYDLGANGRPVSVRIPASSGNAAWNAEAVRAVSASQFAPSARRGCQTVVGRIGPELPLPSLPDTASLASGEGTCPGGDILERPPTLTYPPRFQLRSIHGWAFLRFDVAPWGEIGEIEVLAAEPAAAFGQAARGVLQRSRARSSGEGYSDCLIPIRYTLSEDRDQANANLD